MYKRKQMKYIIIFLSLLVATSCSNNTKREETSKKDTVIIDYLRGTDTVIYDTIALDTVIVKKKSAPNRYTSKCVAYRIWRIS